MKNTTTFLLAHTASNGLNAAQATIDASSEANARWMFETMHPDRIITTVGIREGRAPTRRERKGR